MPCLAFALVTASMIYDGDTVSRRRPDASVRLEAEAFEFDTPEIGFRAACDQEKHLGEQARDTLREMMPGVVCIVERGTGAWGRDVGILYNNQMRDVGPILFDLGLAKKGRTAEWCDP